MFNRNAEPVSTVKLINVGSQINARLLQQQRVVGVSARQALEIAICAGVLSGIWLWSNSMTGTCAARRPRTTWTDQIVHLSGTNLYILPLVWTNNELRLWDSLREFSWNLTLQLIAIIIRYYVNTNTLSHTTCVSELWSQSSLYILWGLLRGASNKVDIARFPLRYATLRCNFSFDGYLHLSRLRNYGGRVHISSLLVQILSKKWQRQK